ncbi:MAG: DUF5074 domain-containing protein [Rikenellaceae bacterium]
MRKLIFSSIILSLAMLAACSSDDITTIDPPKPKPEEPIVYEKYEIIDDNLYYDEMQLGSSKTLWVQPKELKEGSKAEGIVWYLNDKKVGTGVSYTFSPVQEGKYSIKYDISVNNSATGKGQSKLFNLVAYKMGGVYILEEANYSADESCRGVSIHTFGTDGVKEYIKGDFTSFGATSYYIQNWSKTLYNLSDVKTKGVALSQFSTGDAPKMLNKVATFDGAVRTFSGIDENIGIITTTKANIIDLKTLTIKGSLKGSEGATNTFVTEGYLFVITTEGAKAYKLDNLSPTTEPKLLGAATIGFVKSKDGSLWAFNAKELLCINTRDLKTKVIPLPEGVEAKNSSNPWKQFSLAASTKENAIFWVNDSGWGTGNEVYKYVVETNTLIKDFIVSEALSKYMLYGNAILYNAEKDELLCAALKGYGADFSQSAIYTFNASTGAKVGEVLFSTDEGGKNMWANAMLSPIKIY